MHLIIKPWIFGKCLISRVNPIKWSPHFSLKTSSELPELPDENTPYSNKSLPSSSDASNEKSHQSSNSSINVALTFKSFLAYSPDVLCNSSHETNETLHYSSNHSSVPSLPQHLSPVLGAQHVNHRGRNTLVLDLDETLVHSSIKMLSHYSFVLPVKSLDMPTIYVAKRPGVEFFLKTLSTLYEIVIFTASVSDYANPLIDILDPFRCCTWRLFREHCVVRNGRLVKDLSLLGRNLKNVIILDNSPESFSLQPENGIHVKTWLGDTHDTELFRLLPLLEALACVSDICQAIHNLQGFKHEGVTDSGG